MTVSEYIKIFKSLCIFLFPLLTVVSWLVFLVNGCCAKPNNNDFIKPHHKLFRNRKFLTRKCRVIDVTHVLFHLVKGYFWCFLTSYIFHLKDISFGSVVPVSIVATEFWPFLQARWIFSLVSSDVILTCFCKFQNASYLYLLRGTRSLPVLVWSLS